MNRLLEPSEINFLVSAGDFIDESDENLVKDLLAIFIEKNKLPTLQVTEKGGLWFALDNPLLNVIHNLEKQGKFSHVQVETVPLSLVPEKIQSCMYLEGEKIEAQSKNELETEQSEEKKSSHLRRRGFRKLQIEENFGIESDLTKSLSNISLYYEDYEGTFSASSSDASDCDQLFDEQQGKFICNACEAKIFTEQQLIKHQIRRNHFSCQCCKAFFMSLLNLHLHKKAFEHWTDEELKPNGEETENQQAPMERLL